MTTFAPSSTKARAIASPMPWPAPVTTATLPVKRPAIGSPVYDQAVVQDGCRGCKDLRLVWVALASRLIDLDAETGRVGNLPETVDHSDRTVNHLEIPGHGSDHLLLNDVVGGGDGKMQRGDAGDRSERVVRRDADRHRLRHCGDLLRLQKAATVA